MRDDLTAGLRQSVDDTFAERLRFLPMAGGQPDTDRAPLEFSAVLRTGNKARQEASEAVGAPGVGAGGGVMRIDREEWSAITVGAKDKVAALDRSGTPVFEVLAVDDRSHLRLICYLGDA